MIFADGQGGWGYSGKPGGVEVQGMLLTLRRELWRNASSQSAPTLSGAGHSSTRVSDSLLVYKVYVLLFPCFIISKGSL